MPLTDLIRYFNVADNSSESTLYPDAARADAYAACETAESVVHFDRQCRTLHALNFLAQGQHTGGYLQMVVHPHHLLAVQNQRGLVYEAILKRCGLAPDDIVLQVDASSEYPPRTDRYRVGRAVGSGARRRLRSRPGQPVRPARGRLPPPPTTGA